MPAPRWHATMLAQFWASVCLATATHAADPRVPSGTDPGGIAIALIGTGLDYTDPEIAPRLARDGEGELIGWDFVDNDRLPYAATADSSPTPSGTQLARRLLKVYRHTRLIPIRIASMDPAAIANAAALLTRTPARIVAIPAWSKEPLAWEPFRRVASAARTLLFVVAGGDAETLAGAAQTWPAAFRLDNVAVAAPATSFPAAAGTIAAESAAVSVDAWMVTPGASMLPMLAARGEIDVSEAVALAAGLAACAQHDKPAADGSEAKAQLAVLARPAKDNPLLPVHDPMCWYGGVRN